MRGKALGKVFGQWRVIKKSECSYNKVLCECLVCNTEHYVNIYNLLNGASVMCRSCSSKQACLRKRKEALRDITDWGEWTFVDFVHRHLSDGEYYENSGYAKAQELEPECRQCGGREVWDCGKTKYLFLLE